MTDDYPLLRWVRNACCLVFAIILALVLFYAPGVEFFCKKRLVVERGPVLFSCALILGLLLIIAVCIFYRSDCAKRTLGPRGFALYASISTAVLVVLQLVLIYCISFRTGWDVGWLTSGPGNDPALVDYLSRYPNQLFLYSLFSRLMPLGASLGVSGYLFLEVCSAITVTVSLLLVLYAVRSMFGPRVAVAAHLISAFFIGLSPWIVIPYSDTFGMLMPAATLWAYTCLKNKHLQRFLVVLFSLIGYLVKPTSIFILFGICAVEGYRWIKNRSEFKLRRFLQSSACVICAVLIMQLVSLLVVSGTPSLDETKAFSMTHFLMMGANEDAGGGYSGDDVAMSANASDPSARSKLNIETFIKRVGSRTFSQNIDFGLHKLMASFADGTFAWGCEGNFFAEQHGRSPALQSFFGVFPSSEADGAIYAQLCQVLWLFTLSGLALGSLSGEVNKGEVAAYSALIMLAVFLVIFECRARYLLLYMPFFVAFGFVGWVKTGRAVFRRFVSHQ